MKPFRFACTVYYAKEISRMVEEATGRQRLYAADFHDVKRLDFIRLVENQSKGYELGHEWLRNVITTLTSSNPTHVIVSTQMTCTPTDQFKLFEARDFSHPNRMTARDVHDCTLWWVTQMVLESSQEGKE